MYDHDHDLPPGNGKAQKRPKARPFLQPVARERLTGNARKHNRDEYNTVIHNVQKRLRPWRSIVNLVNGDDDSVLEVIATELEVRERRANIHAQLLRRAA